MRISLFKLVVVIPIAIALVFGLIGFRQNASIVRFKQSLIPNKKLNSADVENLISMFGIVQTREKIRTLASEHENLYFDGESRLAQIRKFTHASYNESDMLNLIIVGQNKSWLGNGLSGLRFKSITFKDNGIVVDVYGDLKWDVFKMTIEEENAIAHPIAWPPGVQCRANRSLGEDFVNRNLLLLKAQGGTDD